MLSHLRFHRRAPSSSTSSLPDQRLAQWDVTSPSLALPLDVLSPSDARSCSSNSNASPSMPPILPPITRVSASDSKPAFVLHADLAVYRPKSPANSPSLLEAPPASGPESRPSNTTEGSSRFIGGVALDHYRRSIQGESSRPDSTSNHGIYQASHKCRLRTKPPSPINTSLKLRSSSAAPVLESKSSFITPTDWQHQSVAPTVKRSPDVRLVTEPEPSTTSAVTSESTKGSRKSLPFLKNSMSSLLTRRRNGHNVQDAQPLSFDNEPSYDPRIRGTRVHDFSAPRPRRVKDWIDVKSVPIESLETQRELESMHWTARVAPSDSTGPKAMKDAVKIDGALKEAQNCPAPSLALPEYTSAPATSSVPKDDRQPSPRTSPFTSSEPICTTALPRLAILTKSMSSVKTTGSRASMKSNVSKNLFVSEVAKRDMVMSPLPKHTKSTSSRFSFDMIGAAKQERLLEERHRQRELDRKADDSRARSRDSLYQDIDEDAMYEAMMGDDGFEEQIPEIDDDYDADEIVMKETEKRLEEETLEDEDDGALNDPDNDQLNFAGFVFQRSNPVSASASPIPTEVLYTGRDSNGKALKFPMTTDTTTQNLGSGPGVLFFDPSRDLMDETLHEPVTGLGIQGLDVESRAARKAKANLENEQVPGCGMEPPSKTKLNDDVFFIDDSFKDELDFEPDGDKFDESLFDLDDTDQYGRPIPGLFAQVKKQLAAQKRISSQESEMTSGFSAQSRISPTTSHTSFSIDGQKQLRTVHEMELLTIPGCGFPKAKPAKAWSGSDSAYQAALAEHALKAAASGKFRRESDPHLSHVNTTSSTESGATRGDHLSPDELAGYEDDVFGDYFDEAIIATANAEVLANDSDGFYGQEFGFYSVTMHSMSSSKSRSALSAENLYQHANGGVFSPSGHGLGHSSSGRLVSREPNLTPITERSEYSNRNSTMSFGMPSAWGGGVGSDRNSLQSPGLAQLVLMAEAGDDANMSLSALLKLRSRAWGESQASWPSSSREGSPRSECGGGVGWGPDGGLPWGATPGLVIDHGCTNSSLSLWNQSDTGGSGAASPTLTSIATAIPAVSVVPLRQPSPMLSSCPPVIEDREDDEGTGVNTMTSSTRTPNERLPQPNGTVLVASFNTLRAEPSVSTSLTAASVSSPPSQLRQPPPIDWDHAHTRHVTPE